MDEALSKVKDGSTIMIGGFLGVGAPLKCIDKLVEMGVKNLTLIGIAGSYPGGNFDFDLLFKNGQVKRFITTHIGTSPNGTEQYIKGNLEIVEFYPMGTWIEMIRAGGGGLGGVLTPVGVGILDQEGLFPNTRSKQKITLNGKQYLVYPPLRAEIALIKAWRADEVGNLQYRYVAKNHNPIMAMAADYVVAEVNEIVSVGEIPAENVETPGIFVDALVQGHTLEEEKNIYRELWIRSGKIKPAI